MKVSKLLAAIAAFCFLVAPAISAYAELSSKEDCGCRGRCCGTPASESIGCDSGQFRGCPCVINGYAYVPGGTEVYDTAYYYVSKGSSRGYGRDGLLAGTPDVRAYPDGIESESAGPPDLDVVEYLPHSAQIVFSILASDGPLTQKDLIARTELPPRTVRYALSRLREESVIKECFYFPDARQSLYGVNAQTEAQTQAQASMPRWKAPA